MQALSAVQQSGDLGKIAQANRDVIGVGLRAMAELKVAQGDTAQAIDLYKHALAFDDTPKAHLALALAYMTAHRTDEALVQVEPITKADPQNGDAWNVQGSS